jgi:hypothetical protein
VKRWVREPPHSVSAPVRHSIYVAGVVEGSHTTFLRNVALRVVMELLQRLGGILGRLKALTERGCVKFPLKAL